MLNACEMKTGGQIFGGWKDIQIQRGIEQMSGQYTLQVSDKWSDQPTPRPIHPGDRCSIMIGGTPVLTGVVDDARPGFDKTNTWISVTGRDSTCDVIDCSAIFKAGQWKGATLAKIAGDLVAPFGIKIAVSQEAKARAGETIASFSIEPGEKVFDALDRAGRLKAVMFWADGAGNLVMGVPGKTKAEVALVQGSNIERCEGQFSWHERFSEYIVEGQGRGHGQHAIKATATDPGVTRYRPLIILAEDQTNGPTASQRAEWECTVRRGRANRVQVRVAGWRQHGDTGPLWEPGLLVPLQAPRLNLHVSALIVSTTYIKNTNDGTVTDLEVCDPRAFFLLEGLQAGSLKSTRDSSKGLATKTEKEHHKRKKKEDDWSDLL